MADNKNIIIAVAVVAVVAVAAVAAFFVMNNNGGDDKEPFYFYINYGDNDAKSKWYYAEGKNIDDALTEAVKGTDAMVKYGKNGYPNFSENGTWGTFVYVYSNASKEAAKASVDYPNYDSFGGFLKSNGWISFSGYDYDSDKKLDQNQYNVYYFAEYDMSDYSINDPTESTLWMTAGGENPFTKDVKYDKSYKYYFYVNLGDNNQKTKWYSAEANNVDDALAAALKDSGIKLTYSDYGYPNFDGKSGGVFTYNYYYTDAKALAASVSYPEYDSYDSFVKSNGWSSAAGYGSDAKKLNEFGAFVYMFSMYAEDWSIDDPTEYDSWKTAGGDNPFKKA